MPRSERSSASSPECCERELEYLVRNEWAREAEDVLWRRTKCGLHMTAAEKTRVRAWLAEKA